MPRCVHETQTELCDSFFLGFLQKGFTKLRLYPPKIFEPDSHQILISIEELKSQVLNGFKSPSAIIFKIIDENVCGCYLTHINEYNECKYCGYPSADHTVTCSPIKELKCEIEGVFTNIQGLEWSKFVRNTKIDGATTANEVPKDQDLWDYPFSECN